MTDREKIKMQVVEQVAGNQEWSKAGRAKYLVGTEIVHVRFCSPDRNGTPLYKFNINQNTLSADYELWVCGFANEHYLLPMSIVRKMYNDPHSYPDRQYPGRTVVSVNVDTETVTYAAGGKALSISRYLRGTLSSE